MKRMKKACLLMIVAICIASITTTAFAETKYQVRLFAGDPAVATLNGSQDQSNGYNESASFQIGGSALNIKNSKYYAKGIREAGKDAYSIGSYIAGDNISVTVTRDQDYVVVYGMKKSQVAYTVNCVDGNNSSLRKMTYYGDVGDTPLVTLPYIDGYNPPGTHGKVSHALNADSVQNSFVAKYTKVAASTTTTTTTTSSRTGGGSAISYGSAASAGNSQNGNNTANGTVNNGVNSAANGTANNGVNSAVNNMSTGINNGFQDIVELEASPLTDFAVADTVAVPDAPRVIESTPYTYLPNWALIAGVVVLVILIALLYWYLLFYRKKKKYASSDDDYEILEYDNDEL